MLVSRRLSPRSFSTPSFLSFMTRTWKRANRMTISPLPSVEPLLSVSSVAWNLRNLVYALGLVAAIADFLGGRRVQMGADVPHLTLPRAFGNYISVPQTLANQRRTRRWPVL
jgi:hypothetical protein